MIVKCLGCKKELDAKEFQLRCTCGLYYGLTPYFSKIRNSWYGALRNEYDRK